MYQSSVYIQIFWDICSNQSYTFSKLLWALSCWIPPLPAFAFFWSKAQSHQGTKNDNRLLKFFWLNSRYTSSYLHLFTSPQIKLARFHLTATCDPCPPFPDQIFRFELTVENVTLQCIIFSGGDQYHWYKANFLICNCSHTWNIASLFQTKPILKSNLKFIT